MLTTILPVKRLAKDKSRRQSRLCYLLLSHKIVGLDERGHNPNINCVIHCVKQHNRTGGEANAGSSVFELLRGAHRGDRLRFDTGHPASGCSSI